MSTTVNPAFEPDARDIRLHNRAVTGSMTFHVVIVLAVLFLPREWFGKKPPAHVMTISLGGAVAPRTTGMTNIGGRTVEEVAPPPKRPEPVKPTPPKKDVTAPLSVKTPAQTKAPPKAAPPPTPDPVRPPVTGRQVVQGNTPVDTGARGEGAGLTVKQGATEGEQDDLKDFCCPDYLTDLTGTISGRWNKTNAQGRGTAVIKFTIHRDGTVDGVALETSSGNGVDDRTAQRALSNLRLLPLPAQYPRDQLIIHLLFPYSGTKE